MRRTNIGVLVLVLLGCTGLFLLLRAPLENHGWRLSPHTWAEHIVLLILAALIFSLAWQVRQFQEGKRPNLDALKAARALILAKAGAITGMILGGRYLAAILGHVGQLDLPQFRSRALAAGLALGCCLILTVVSLVSERFCELPPGDDEQAKLQEKERQAARFVDSELLPG